jgi:TonB-linked SusC/RagA family outer membrane protein
MEKKIIDVWLIQPNAYYYKLLRIMKITILLSLTCVLNTIANSSYSQTTKITLNLKNVRIEEVLNKIEEKSEYYFLLNHKLVDINRRVDVFMENSSIKDILASIFKDESINYMVYDRQIILTPKTSDLVSEMQQRIISGTVTDATTGEPLPGVNIVVKETTIGTITDSNGKYTIQLPSPNAVLIFSFVGYVNGIVETSGRTEINVTLVPDVVALKEVVVTALGINREKKTLTYATRQVKGDELNETREINISSALQGKIAGLNISSTNSGPGGSSRLILRGDKSLAGNNQPLIVLDGVPIDNRSKANAETSNGARDNGDGLSNINSDDIESLSVLPGPAAAALYGSAASNGVIIINTKKGTGKKNGLGVSLSSSLIFSNPMIYPKLQNEFGQGIGGSYQSNSEYSWGPKMTGQVVTDWTGKQSSLSPQPNNYRDFFRTGTEAINTLAVTSGHTYFSYTNTSSKGIIPNNKYGRNNFNIRETFELAKGLSVDTKFTYVLEDDINRQSTGARNYAVCSLYQIPRSIHIEDAKDYESIVGTDRIQNYWNPGSFNLQNPYWTVYRNLYERTRRRTIGMASLKYQITEALSAQVRGSADYYNDFTEEKDYNNSYWVETPGQGNYIVKKESNRLLTADALISFNKNITSSINLNLNAGASIERTDFEGNTVDNDGLVIPNAFTTLNALGLSTTQSMDKLEKHSVYAAAQIGIKNIMFINATGRNDWNSTLPTKNLSYYYPSLGANLIVSELFHLPKAISFLKLRGTYAVVGNGTAFDAYRRARYEQRVAGNSIYLYSDGTLYNEDLVPEKTRSWEEGFELNMWKNRLGLDVSFYNSTTSNQILTIPMASTSGYLRRVINAGEIENKGVEVTLNGKPFSSDNFSWDIGVTFSKNVNKVTELSPENKKLILVWDHIANITAYVGDKFGDLWVSDFKRNSSGQIIVDNTGMPLISDKEYRAGNSNPDWRAGIMNTFRYKNLSFSALIDIRQGGVIISHTQALLSAMGCSENTLANREANFVIPNSVKDNGSVNDIPISAESYWKIVGTGDPVGRLFTYDASNIRLRELSISYTLPKSLVQKGYIKEATISFIGRNLFFFSNKAGVVDPEATSVGTGNAQQGIDYCSNPSLRSFGFQLGLKF